MIRPFALADILLVYRLQNDGVPLAIEHILSHPRPPLWLALTAPWPWAGRGVATYVLRERSQGRQMQGFAQLLKRAARPEADLLHIAPAHAVAPGGGPPEGGPPEGGPPEGDPISDAIWRRLLLHCCAEAARHGLQRVFASVPDGGPEMACLRDAGFSLYARETIYRLAEVPPAVPVPAGFRRQSPRDSWALQRLYAQSTPCLVQQAEGAMTGEAGSPPLSWWEPNRWRGVVWAPAGEVRGAVRVNVGRAGHWLRVLGANALTAREMRALVEQGLQLLATLTPRHTPGSLPVYATVRDYEIGLSAALTGFGFAPYTDRARFVKHTVAMRRVPARSALPAIEVRQEVPVRSQAQGPIRSAHEAKSRG